MSLGALESTTPQDQEASDGVLQAKGAGAPASPSAPPRPHQASSRPAPGSLFGVPPPGQQGASEDPAKLGLGVPRERPAQPPKTLSLSHDAVNALVVRNGQRGARSHPDEDRQMQRRCEDLMSSRSARRPRSSHQGGRGPPGTLPGPLCVRNFPDHDRGLLARFTPSESFSPPRWGCRSRTAPRPRTRTRPRCRASRSAATPRTGSSSGPSWP